MEKVEMKVLWRKWGNVWNWPLENLRAYVVIDHLICF